MEAFLTIIIFVMIYLFPGINALRRGHHQAQPIFWTNLLLGWSVIGWIAAFIWSTSQVKKG